MSILFFISVMIGFGNFVNNIVFKNKFDKKLNPIIALIALLTLSTTRLIQIDEIRNTTTYTLAIFIFILSITGIVKTKLYKKMNVKLLLVFIFVILTPILVNLFYTKVLSVEHSILHWDYWLYKDFVKTGIEGGYHFHDNYIYTLSSMYNFIGSIIRIDEGVLSSVISYQQFTTIIFTSIAFIIIFSLIKWTKVKSILFVAIWFVLWLLDIEEIQTIMVGLGYLFLPFYLLWKERDAKVGAVLLAALMFFISTVIVILPLYLLSLKWLDKKISKTVLVTQIICSTPLALIALIWPSIKGNFGAGDLTMLALVASLPIIYLLPKTPFKMIEVKLNKVPFIWVVIIMALSLIIGIVLIVNTSEYRPQWNWFLLTPIYIVSFWLVAKTTISGFGSQFKSFMVVILAIHAILLLASHFLLDNEMISAIHRVLNAIFIWEGGHLNILPILLFLSMFMDDKKIRNEKVILTKII